MRTRFRPDAALAPRRRYSQIDAVVIALSGSLKKPSTRAERRAAERAERRALVLADRYAAEWRKARATRESDQSESTSGNSHRAA